MTDVIETTHVVKDGWQIARIILHHNGAELRFDLRFKPGEAVYYIARQGSHSLGSRGDVALQNWLGLKAVSDAPEFRAFVERWHRKAARVR